MPLHVFANKNFEHSIYHYLCMLKIISFIHYGRNHVFIAINDYVCHHVVHITTNASSLQHNSWKSLGNKPRVVDAT